MEKLGHVASRRKMDRGRRARYPGVESWGGWRLVFCAVIVICTGMRQGETALRLHKECQAKFECWEGLRQFFLSILISG